MGTKEQSALPLDMYPPMGSWTVRSGERKAPAELLELQSRIQSRPQQKSSLIMGLGGLDATLAVAGVEKTTRTPH